MRDTWQSWRKELEAHLRRVGKDEALGPKLPWEFLDGFLAALRLDRQLIEGTVHPLAVIEGPVYIGSGSVIEPFTHIKGPAYIGKDCRIGPHAFLRDGVALCDRVRIGNSEVKHSLMFSGSAALHSSYIGDSVIGRHCNFGAGTKTANYRLDEENVPVWVDGKKYDTGSYKVGVIMEDDVKCALDTNFKPGAYIAAGSRISTAAFYDPRK